MNKPKFLHTFGLQASIRKVAKRRKSLKGQERELNKQLNTQKHILQMVFFTSYRCKF